MNEKFNSFVVFFFGVPGWKNYTCPQCAGLPTIGDIESDERRVRGQTVLDIKYAVFCENCGTKTGQASMTRAGNFFDQTGKITDVFGVEHSVRFGDPMVTISFVEYLFKKGEFSKVETLLHRIITYDPEVDSFEWDQEDLFCKFLYERFPIFAERRKNM